MRDPNRVELGLNLYLDGECKPAAYVGWCLADGSKFCGNALNDQGVRGEVFCDIGELCDLAGFDRDAGFDPWHFGRVYKKGSSDIDMLPVVEPGQRFDGRALAARSRDYRVGAKNMFKEKKPSTAAASCLTPFLVVGAGGSTPRAPPPAYVVGDPRKRAQARKRAEAAATRHQPTTPAQSPHSSPASLTVTTTTVRSKAKRDREPRSTSCDDSARAGLAHLASVAPIYEYATPLDMFAHWYDGKHGVLGCDESLDVRTVWEAILPASRPTKGKHWCRAYWEEKHARKYEQACMTRSNWVTDPDGKWKRIDMPALDVLPSRGYLSNCGGGGSDDDVHDNNSDAGSDDDGDGDDDANKNDDAGDINDKDLAMAFFSDSKGTVVDPRDVSYALWDQPLMDRWLRRSARSSSHDADPKIEAIVGRRWAFGTHMRYLCAWARPDTGVNARRLVRAASQNSGSLWSTPDTPTTWHAASVLCTNPRYATQVKAYEAALRACALSAVDVFLSRMDAAGYKDILSVLAIEARIALYGLGILSRDADGPPPESPCVFPPGYLMATRDELMSKAPHAPVRAPTIRLIPRDPDADRAYRALMSASVSPPQAQASAAPDGREGVRAQRRAEMAIARRVKRIMRREWTRVERRQGLLAGVQVDGQDQGHDEDDEFDDVAGATRAGGGDAYSSGTSSKAHGSGNPFWVVVERCMRDLEIAE